MKKLWAFLTLMFFLAGLPAQAQEPLRLSAVEVKIWPEFDRPAVLVINHLTLPPETTLPVTIALRIPAEAEINAVAVEDAEVGLVNAYYEQTPGETWTILSIRAFSPDVWVEYYMALKVQGTTRQIEYQWPGDMAVDDFSVSFQLPIGGKNASTDPLPARLEFDSYNLRNFVTPTVSLEAGETYLFTARYDKADDTLSVSGVSIEPALPLEDTGGGVSWTDVLPWVVGALGLGLIVLGLLVLFGFLKGQPASRLKQGRRSQTFSSRRSLQVVSEEETMIYCHTCGHRARPGDQFCRTCGTRLRREE